MVHPKNKKICVYYAVLYVKNMCIDSTRRRHLAIVCSMSCSAFIIPVICSVPGTMHRKISKTFIPVYNSPQERRYVYEPVVHLKDIPVRRQFTYKILLDFRFMYM